MRHVAHIREDQSEQLLSEHLKGTARRASNFAKVFDAGEEAYRIGLVHDQGKYSKEFQEYIRGTGISPDHATAGAQTLFAQEDFAGRLCGGGPPRRTARRRREGGYGRPDADGAHEKEGVPLPRFPPGDLAAGRFAGRAGQGGSLRPVRLHTHAVLLSGRCGFFGYGMVHEGRPGG